MLEQVLSYGKTALSRSDHRPWAQGVAVGAGGKGVRGNHIDRRKSWIWGLRWKVQVRRAGKFCRWKSCTWGEKPRTISELPQT